MATINGVKRALCPISVGRRPTELTRIPVSSFQTHTEAGESPDTTNTLVKRRLITAGWSLNWGGDTS